MTSAIASAKIYVRFFFFMYSIVILFSNQNFADQDSYI